MQKIKCSKCGNEIEFYIRQSYYGAGNFYFRLDGKEADNSNMYASAQHKLGKIVYCAECNSKVIELQDLEIDFN